MDETASMTTDRLLARLTELETSAGTLAGDCQHPHTTELLGRVVDALADARTVLMLERLSGRRAGQRPHRPQP